MHPPRSNTNKRRHVPASPPLGGIALDDPSSNQGFYPGWLPPPTGPAELENQFIMRLPKEPAEALREALRSGASNIKERLAIQLEPDKTSTNTSYLRKGYIEFDGWSMNTKLMDLPTVIGSYKTIDKKNFYKTADICQILICKEGEPSEDEETAAEEPKVKRQDPIKADRKYRYPHGLTNPMKNCRKRRFRKTLKKKFVEAPEVEKEVKRLFRVDNDAASVKWELVTEEELNMGKAKKDMKEEAPLTTDESKVTVEAHDIFGALSDSDDDRPNADVDIDSEGDDSNTFFQTDSTKGTSQSGPTQFSKEMFPPKNEEKKEKGIVAQKLEKLRMEINQLRQQKIDLENNIAHCDNQVLLQRFKETLNDLNREIDQKVVDEESMSMMFS
ncbi:uncharacterized protein Taf7 [Lepeophtheirus salmonis]|nr:transcription initiation factor TFIID subunit 7-like [Lepeophtheirus salmonis]